MLSSEKNEKGMTRASCGAIYKLASADIPSLDPSGKTALCQGILLLARVYTQLELAFG